MERIPFIAVLVVLLFVTPAFSADTVYFRSGMEVSSDYEQIKRVDRRHLQSSDSPTFLSAVGRLRIIKTNGEVSYCTAFPPDFAGNRNEIRYFQTSAHCLLDPDTRLPLDTQSIQWSTFVDGWRLLQASVDVQHVDPPNDVAVLKARQALSMDAIKPLTVTSAKHLNGENLMIAGYHGDIGNNGMRMAIDDDVPKNGVVIESGRTIVETVAFTGSSGGPVLLVEDKSKPVVVGMVRGNGRKDKQYLVNGQRGSDRVEITPSKWMLESLKGFEEL